MAKRFGWLSFGRKKKSAERAAPAGEDQPGTGLDALDRALTADRQGVPGPQPMSPTPSGQPSDGVALADELDLDLRQNVLAERPHQGLRRKLVAPCPRSPMPPRYAQPAVRRPRATMWPHRVKGGSRFTVRSIESAPRTPRGVRIRRVRAQGSLQRGHSILLPSGKAMSRVVPAPGSSSRLGLSKRRPNRELDRDRERCLTLCRYR